MSDEGEREERARAWGVVLAHQSLVRLRAARFRSRGQGRDDLLQEARIGAYCGARKFDASRRMKFPTFGRHWIDRYVRLAAVAGNSVMRLPWQVRAAAKSVRKGDVSLDSLSPTRRRGVATAEAATRQPLTLGVGPDPLDVVEDRPGPGAAIEEREEGEALGRAMEALGPRERDVIRQRFYEERTLKQVGESLGVTSERARQIEGIALGKLRVRMGAA